MYDGVDTAPRVVADDVETIPADPASGANSDAGFTAPPPLTTKFGKFSKFCQLAASHQQYSKTRGRRRRGRRWGRRGRLRAFLLREGGKSDKQECSHPAACKRPWSTNSPCDLHVRTQRRVNDLKRQITRSFNDSQCKSYSIEWVQQLRR